MVKNLKQKSICGEELNTEQYAWCRVDTELCTWSRAKSKKTRSKMMEDEFLCPI